MISPAAFLCQFYFVTSGKAYLVQQRGRRANASMLLKSVDLARSLACLVALAVAPSTTAGAQPKATRMEQ
eukprot:6246757-Amphidinium_carterae.1